MQIHVLTITHDSGSNVYLFSTYEKAQLRVEAWVKQYWVQELHTEIPIELTGEDLVEEYFERMSDTEGYEIDLATLDADD